MGFFGGRGYGLSRFGLVSSGPVKGKAYLEAGSAWLGLYCNEAGVLADDALYGVQAEPKAAAGSFCGEERLEDAGADGRGYAGGTVPDFNQRHGAVEMGDQAKRSHVVHALKGVFDQRGPHLIEFAAVSADGREVRVEVELDRDVLQPGIEHYER